MPNRRLRAQPTEHSAVNLSRLEALGDAIFAFALTLLAFDLKIPEIASSAFAQGLAPMLPKLAIFVFAFLVIAQEWDVHQRTIMHIARANGLFVWLYLISLMFVVLMPTAADLLGRYPLQPLALTCFGVNTMLYCLSSWVMWRYASHRGRLMDDGIQPFIVKMVSRLWLYPPLIIAITIPVGFLSVYPVYVVWLLMPVFSYSYSVWTVRRRKIVHV